MRKGGRAYRRVNGAGAAYRCGLLSLLLIHDQIADHRAVVRDIRMRQTDNAVNAGLVGAEADDGLLAFLDLPFNVQPLDHERMAGAVDAEDAEPDVVAFF